MTYVYVILGTALATSGAEFALGYNLIDYLKDKAVALYHATIGRL